MHCKKCEKEFEPIRYNQIFCSRKCTRRFHRKADYDPDKHYQKKYGISLEEFLNKIEDQNNQCDICKQTLIKPHLDHQELPFKLRGVLCCKCNMALGLFNHNTKNLIQAALYLEKHSGS